MKTDITKVINLKSSKLIAILTMQTYLKDTQYSPRCRKRRKDNSYKATNTKRPFI